MNAHTQQQADTLQGSETLYMIINTHYLTTAQMEKQVNEKKALEIRLAKAHGAIVDCLYECFEKPALMKYQYTLGVIKNSMKEMIERAANDPKVQQP